MKKGFAVLLWTCFVTIQVQAQLTEEKILSLYKAQAPELTALDLDEFRVADQYTDAHSGITHVYLQQYVKGIPVYNGVSSIHLNVNKQVVSLTKAYITDAAQKINADQPSIGNSLALLNAGKSVAMNLAPALAKADYTLSKGKSWELLDPSISTEKLTSKLVYMHIGGQLRLAYQIEVFNPETHDWWHIRVDAITGEVMDKGNYTVHCSFDSPVHEHHDGLDNSTQHASIVSVSASTAAKKKTAVQHGTYNVVPFPAESPNHGSREMISGSIAKLNASPYGWHDTNAVAGPEFTVTKGNNVMADEDTLASNGNGFSPSGGDSLIFDFPIDTNWLDYKLNIPASITNLYYANNVIHDVLYQYGFTETAGNFQFNNYGKGGRQLDPVQAEAQDGSGTGNANFSTLPDGSTARMQMFLWPTTSAAAPRASVTVNSGTASTHDALISSFGNRRFEPIVRQVILVDDGSAADSLGCGQLINTNLLEGNIALVYRGTCGLTNKILNAQNAGAVAVLMVNNSTSTFQSMTSQGQSAASITIPSFLIRPESGRFLKNAIDAGDTVVATLAGIPTVKAYDSDFDNGVIAHEYGHGVSNRLTGGPSNTSCLTNAEQAGEGWSDFFALAFTAKEGDKGEDAKGIGTFVFNQPITGNGIRDFRYSTNMRINPMTYSYISNDRGVHYVGTIWCTMLWDMYWNMVKKYGFDPDVYNGTGGNNKAIQLVMDGMKLQPCNPGFVDARNAIIKADSILYGGANRELIWNSFAKRGLGLSASQGSSNSVADGKAAFDLPAGVTALNDVQNLGEFIEVKPNPVVDQLVIVMPDQIKQANISIYDISGKVVLSNRYDTNDSQHILLNTEGIESGIYFLTIQEGATQRTQKLVIAH